MPFWHSSNINGHRLRVLGEDYLVIVVSFLLCIFRKSSNQYNLLLISWHEGWNMPFWHSSSINGQHGLRVLGEDYLVICGIIFALYFSEE